LRFTVSAEGYLPSTLVINVEARKESRASIALNKKPARPNVVVTNRELKLRKKVHFQHDSAELLPDSHALIQEAAQVLKERTNIQLVEIQGHTDNTGNAAYNKRLSQERADAVMKTLIDLGVEASRLTAMGYGQERPLVPNVSNANRARNRRVQLIIKKK